MQVRLILLGLLLAQLGDVGTFFIGHELHGIALESNGFAVAAYRAAGIEGVLLLKGAAISVVLLALAASAARFPRVLVWGGAAATAFGLLGVLANVSSMMLVAG
jgi:hypothetical protein